MLMLSLDIQILRFLSHFFTPGLFPEFPLAAPSARRKWSWPEMRSIGANRRAHLENPKNARKAILGCPWKLVTSSQVGL